MVLATLCPEKEVKTTSLEDGIAQLESDFRVEHTETALDELALDTEGHLTRQGERHPMTKWALESLCGVVGIPASFARKIPWDLLRHNFEELKAKRDCRMMLALGRERTLINVIEQRKLGYFPAKSIDVLRSLQGLERQLQVHGLRIADRGIEVSFLDPAVGTLEPAVGDITGIGLRLTNSETGYRGLKASSFLLRLVCTNGAVLSNDWGSAEWSYDPRMDYERSLASFFQRVPGLSLSVQRLREAYQTMFQKNLPVLGLVNLWRRVARIAGPDHADSILGIPQERRKALVKATRERAAREESRTQESETSYWQAYNAITERARAYDFLRWRQLERVGGGLIDEASRPERSAMIALPATENGAAAQDDILEPDEG